MYWLYTEIVGFYLNIAICFIYGLRSRFVTDQQEKTLEIKQMIYVLQDEGIEGVKIERDIDEPTYQ